MAFVQGNWRISFTVSDQQGDTSVVAYEAEAGVYDDAETLAQAVLPLLQAITSAKVIQYSIASVFEETDTALYYPANSSVEAKAVVTVQLDDISKKATVTIPSPVNAIFINAGVGKSGNVVDITNAALEAFIDEFDSANPSHLLISDGETIANMISGVRTVRRRQAPRL